jgi:hypothetical protein
MEQYLAIILSALTLLGLVLGFADKIFKRGGKEKNIDDRVGALESSDCTLKDNIVEITCDIKKIKENHLAHIQSDINGINIKMERIETTLEFIKNK